MPRRRPTTNGGDIPKSPPAMSDEARENQITAAAYDLAEQRILNGTASAQEIVYFLKRGSKKEKLEQEILEEQKKLVVAKTDAIESDKKTEEFYARVIDAMKMYSGNGGSDEPGAY